MKIILSILLAITSNAFASDLVWSDLVKGNTYTLTQTIGLEKLDTKTKAEVPAGASLRLEDRMSLPMIKVELYKFDLSKYCDDNDLTTDISLIEIKQPNGKIITVGADIAEDCLLEVYLETKDSFTTSIFK